ncbi:uncharacterized protein LOC122964122 isoform X2 [Acropora millepora]|uniref:uncharacterized protein LOC122964122 isoform X2 n=1 Tax=Acropora millepora TaxID=45264 RepID=UPI001CF519E0|nr:uncharacterized protein LOC122964122 isoform X2 [Acropora millepora]
MCSTLFTKPHPLSSPVNKYSSLIRAQTFSSVLDNVDIPVETSSARNFSKAPLRLKFALSPKGAAWNLEDDEDIESAISCCTDGVPFGYTAGGLYYSTDQHLQLLHSTMQGCKEDCPLSSETEKKHSVIKETRISKLARRFSQRKEKINIRKEERSHSLEDLESSQQAKLQQASNKSPKLQRTMSVIQRSSPRLRLSVQENRFSFNNKDFKEKCKKKKTDASVDALIEAIVRNESDHMRNILESELIDVNGLNDDGFSPLDVAVMLGRPSVIKMLLLYGAQEGTKCKCFAHVSILNLLFILVFSLQYGIYALSISFSLY